MGYAYEIHVWERRDGQPYAWHSVWAGNSRTRLVLALVPALAARQRRPLRVIYR